MPPPLQCQQCASDRWINIAAQSHFWQAELCTTPNASSFFDLTGHGSSFPLPGHRGTERWNKEGLVLKPDDKQHRSPPMRENMIHQ